MVDKTLLDRIARTIVDRLSPERIVLFGSLARGEEDSASDVDLFVEMKTDKRPPDRAIEVSSLFGLRSWGLDVVVYTPEEVERLRGIKGTLLDIVESEGKVLYERPRA